MRQLGTPETEPHRAVVTAVRFALPKRVFIQDCPVAITKARSQGAEVEPDGI
ncbi:hypothetical protein N9H60_03915 [Flavimaricola sp.]|nr:hypothetical protein [Flavimaricola sp.]MDA9020298.1 hypothetical protein [Flavimaricola sp.]